MVDPPAPSASTPDAAPQRKTRNRNVVRIVIASLALVFFFGPALAAAAGVRTPAIENHKLGPLPKASDGWSSFSIFDTWATDHLPLRNDAIKANTTVERDVFGETPDYGANGTATTTTAAGVAGISAPQPPAPAASSAPPDFPTVVAGIDGWLYYGTDFRDACNPVLSPAVIAQQFGRLSQIIQRAGKKFVMVIAPDKSDIYPEYLPVADQGVTCTSKAQAALWAALAANPPAGYLDLHSALLAAKKQAPATLLYRKLDTHWNGRGALIYGKLLADSLNPQLWQTTTVTPAGESNANTDLEALLGLRTPEQAPLFTVTRPGVVQTKNTDFQVANTTTNAPLVTAPTLFISDSFTESARFAINPFFQAAGFINSSAAGSAFASLVSAISSSKLVVLEIVERDVVGGQAPILQTSVLDHLASALGEG
jgi:alginate O-acetyltransferase complex protein AlgJ